MKNPKSSSPNGISSFYFALHPQSLAFAAPPSNQFVLYLQKNLQILGRFPSYGHFAPKQKITFFNFPDKVTSFRILSDKNLTYQWSLYQTKMNEDETHEEFIQSIKFDLASFWNNFNTKNERFKQQQIAFKKIKCRLSFLIAVGNQKQILQNIQQPFLMRIQANKPIKMPQLSIVQSRIFQAEENSASNQKKNNVDKENNQPRAEAIQNQAVINDRNQQVDENTQNGIILRKTTSFLLLPKDQIKPATSQYLQTPTKILSPDKKSDSPDLDAMLNSQLKLHLTLSEVDISKEIQRKIKEAEKKILAPIDQTKELQNILNNTVHEELMSKYRKQKKKKITQSQILTHNGQIMVTPFYKHTKYYFIMIAVIVIFLGLISVNPQSLSHHHAQHVVKPKKSKERNPVHKHKKKRQK